MNTLLADAERGQALIDALGASWVNGRFVAGEGGTMSHRNPANDQDLGDTWTADARIVDLAVATARKGFETGWGAMPA